MKRRQMEPGVTRKARGAGGGGKVVAEGILLLYHHPLFRSATTIMENVTAFERHSRFAVWPVNTELGFPRGLSRLRFPVVVLHYSLWEPRGYHLDARFLEYLLDCAGSRKVAFFQDEHHFCRQRFAFIRDYGIDCIYTLLEPEHVKDVYGKYTPAVLHVVSHIPGYVSDDLVKKAARFRLTFGRRTIDVGYRGRVLKPYMGREAMEKGEIGREFLRRAEGRGLRLDIGTRESSRLYGDDWYRFIGNCRAFLGVEAGVSIFDLEDTVRLEYERRAASDPRVSYEKMPQDVLSRWEGAVYYRTVSPRHFEAAAFRTGQILYEGRYSGVLDPMRHYIPLKKDFSNFGDVLAMLQDDGFMERLAERAHEDLIASGRYGYGKFIREFDEKLITIGFSAGNGRTGKTGSVEALLAEDYRGRYLAARARALFHAPFPGRRPLVKAVKTILGRPDPDRAMP